MEKAIDTERWNTGQAIKSICSTITDQELGQLIDYIIDQRLTAEKRERERIIDWLYDGSPYHKDIENALGIIGKDELREALTNPNK